MNFIKKIFEGDIDESVHLQFQKFGRGKFRDRAMIKARQSKGKYTIRTTYEFANEMVKIVAEKLGDEKTNIKGVIISTNDLSGKLDFQDKKQFQGVKKYIIDKQMSGNEIISLINKFPRAFFALSFKTEKDNTILKIKPKAPKSAKPKNKEEKPKPDFCKLETMDRELGTSFVFEKPDFSKGEINHIFFIDEIIMPDGESDFAKIREMAKRKGEIIREATIDGKKIKSKKEFIA